MPTGTILVEAPERKNVGAELDARVSSADQEADLDRQVARLAACAAERGIGVAKLGTGLNGHRNGLLAALRSPEYGVLVVEHRDRLARRGSEYIEAALAATGRRLVVMEPDEVKDGLVQAMIDVRTSFCARLSGRRSARRRAAQALARVAEEPSCGRTRLSDAPWIPLLAPSRFWPPTWERGGSSTTGGWLGEGAPGRPPPGGSRGRCPPVGAKGTASRQGRRPDRRLGVPRFRKQGRRRESVRFTTGAIRVDAQSHVVRPWIGRVRTP